MPPIRLQFEVLACGNLMCRQLIGSYHPAFVSCAQGLRTSLELARPGGQVVWLGKMPVAQKLSLRWGSPMGEKRIVRSSHGGAGAQRDFPMHAQACLDVRLPRKEYATSKISLDEVNTGLHRLCQGQDIRSVMLLQTGP